ncbi:hypothetical protein NKG94_28475 [Micromonospora sp. M12]
MRVVPQDTRPAVVIGVDIGTTSTKAVAYDTDGRQLGSHSVGYPLDDPNPGTPSRTRSSSSTRC